jgi:hypothetical protein
VRLPFTAAAGLSRKQKKMKKRGKSRHPSRGTNERKDNSLIFDHKREQGQQREQYYRRVIALKSASEG